MASQPASSCLARNGQHIGHAVGVFFASSATAGMDGCWQRAGCCGVTTPASAGEGTDGVPAPPPAAPEPERPTQARPGRVDAQPDVPTTSPSHAQPADVCARYGGRRVDFMRGHHAMWRCIYPRHR
jgi:hypothetical protein